jgi:hypothetical protein
MLAARFLFVKLSQSVIPVAISLGIAKNLAVLARTINELTSIPGELCCRGGGFWKSVITEADIHDRGGPHSLDHETQKLS